MSELNRSDLARLHAAATNGPWCWAQIGEKVNGYILGTGEDESGKPYDGLVEDDDELCEPLLIGEHEAATCNYHDPALIVYLRNHAESILDLLARNEALEEAVRAALAHSGQCLCCRLWYEESLDAATRSSAQHDEDCYISVCRRALSNLGEVRG